MPSPASPRLLRRGPGHTAGLLALTLAVLIAGCTGGLLALALHGPRGSTPGPVNARLVEFPQFPAIGQSGATRGGRVASAPASPPVEVIIPSLGIRSALAGLHLQPDGTIQVPSDADQVGWDADGPAPGDAGAAVLVGHLDSRTGPAVFYRLRRLSAGDVIQVRRAGGDTVSFRVDRAASYPQGHIPASVFESPGRALRLITCSGPYDRASGHYLDNLVVFASGFQAP